MLAKNKIKELLDIASEKRLTVISDETYRDIVYSGDEFTIVNYNLENTVSIYSFSKTFSVPGLRIGYAVGDKRLVRLIGKFIQATYTSIPVFVQKVAIKALELRDKVAERVRRVFRKRIEVFTKHIDTHKYDYLTPSGAFYVFLKIRKNSISSIDLSLKLVERGVGVFPGIAFGNKYDNFIRVSLVCPKERIIEGVKILNEVVG